MKHLQLAIRSIALWLAIPLAAPHSAWALKAQAGLESNAEAQLQEALSTGQEEMEAKVQGLMSQLDADPRAQIEALRQLGALADTAPEEIRKAIPKIRGLLAADNVRAWGNWVLEKLGEQVEPALTDVDEAALTPAVHYDARYVQVANGPKRGRKEGIRIPWNRLVNLLERGALEIDQGPDLEKWVLSLGQDVLGLSLNIRNVGIDSGTRLGLSHEPLRFGAWDRFTFHLVKDEDDKPIWLELYSDETPLFFDRSSLLILKTPTGQEETPLWEERREGDDLLLHVGGGRWIQPVLNQRMAPYSEILLGFLRKPGFLQQEWDVLDLGTGGATIPVGIADLVRSVDGVELNLDLLRLGRENVERNGLGNVKIFRGNFTAPLKAREKRYDLIVSDPAAAPFTDEMRRFHIDRMPERADIINMGSDGGPHGRSMIEQILQEAPALLKENGKILLAVPEWAGIREVGRYAQGQGMQMRTRFRQEVFLPQDADKSALYLRFQETIERANNVPFLRSEDGALGTRGFVLEFAPIPRTGQEEQTFLVVDDDSDELAATVKAIRALRPGTKVITAEDGKAAQDMIEAQGEGIDAVISDLGMPRVNGYQLLDWLKARGWQKPAAIIAKHVDEQSVSEELDLIMRDGILVAYAEKSRHAGALRGEANKLLEAIDSAAGQEETPLWEERREGDDLLLHVGGGRWIQTLFGQRTFLHSEALLEFLLEEGFLQPEWDVLDLGTASAMIPVGIADRVRSVDGVELNLDLLRLGRENIKRNKLHNVSIIRGNLTEPLKRKRKLYDLIVSDPAAVPFTDAMRKFHIDRMPDQAGIVNMSSDGGSTGRAMIEQILRKAPALLKENGEILLAVPEWAGIPEIERFAQSQELQMRTRFQQEIFFPQVAGKGTLYLRFQKTIERANNVSFLRSASGALGTRVFILEFTHAPRAGQEEGWQLIGKETSLQEGDFLFLPGEGIFEIARLTSVDVAARSGSLRLRPAGQGRIEGVYPTYQLSTLDAGAMHMPFARLASLRRGRVQDLGDLRVGDILEIDAYDWEENGFFEITRLPGARQLKALGQREVTYVAVRTLISSPHQSGTGSLSLATLERDTVYLIRLESPHAGQEENLIAKRANKVLTQAARFRERVLKIKGPDKQKVQLRYRTYENQWKFLQAIGVARHIIYPAIGTDFVPALVAEEVLGIDPKLSLSGMHRLTMTEITLEADVGLKIKGVGAALKRIQVVPYAFSSRHAISAIDQFLEEAHQQGSASVVIKNLREYGKGKSIQQFLAQVEPRLAPGDFVIVFHDPELAAQLRKRGYRNYLSKSRYSTETIEAIQQANNHLLDPMSAAPFPYSLRVSSLNFHLAEPFTVLRKPKRRSSMPDVGLEERELAVSCDLAVAALERFSTVLSVVNVAQVLVFTDAETFDLVPLAVRWGWAVAVDYDGPEAEALDELLAALDQRGALGPYAIGRRATRQFLREYSEQVKIDNRQNGLRRLGLKPWDLPQAIREVLGVVQDYLGQFV